MSSPTQGGLCSPILPLSLVSILLFSITGRREHLPCIKHDTMHFANTIYYQHHKNQDCTYYYHNVYFADEESEAQWGTVICPEPQSQNVKSRLWPSSQSNSNFLFTVLFWFSALPISLPLSHCVLLGKLPDFFGPQWGPLRSLPALRVYEHS